MKGYSKIKLVNSSKSRSIDFLDKTTINTSTPKFIIQKSTSNNKPTIQFQYDQDDDDDDDDYKHYSSHNCDNNNQQQEDHSNNLPNQKLTKNQPEDPNGSKTTTEISTKDNTHIYSNRFKIEKQNSTGRALQSAVIRAMSIRRSSSVTSERYSRIHDQYANTFDVDHHYGHEEKQLEEEKDLKYARSKNNMKKHMNKGSILKACKRIFGL